MNNTLINTQTLKAIAASFNLYQVADIPERYINENFDFRIKVDKKDIPEFLTTLNTIEVGLFYHCKQDTNYEKITTYYIEHSYILVKGIDSNNVLMLQKDRNGKYDFHPYYDVVRKFFNITYDIKKTALKNLVKPNDIGVFTAKKVSDWLTYCNDYLNVLDGVLNDVNNANKAIEGMISNFIASIPNCKVSTYQNITDIDTKLFRVRFTHYKDQKYCSKNIDFKGSIDDITIIETMKDTITSF